jgi:hypothetical protein
MFESFEEAERDRGIKSFLARWVGPVQRVEAAETGIQRIALFFLSLLSLAVVSGIVGPAVYRNPESLKTALVLGSMALALYWSRSRIVASVLLGLLLANALLHLRAPFSWVWVLLALRAVQLTFGYQRLRNLG